VDAKRLLTAEDFDLIRRLKEAQAERLEDPKLRSKGSLAARKRKLEEDENVTSFIVTEDRLAPEARTHKSTKVERITRILEGRKETQFEHNGHAGGLTNAEKRRKKNYVMVRKGKRSVANKPRTSNSDIRYKKMHAVRLTKILFLFYYIFINLIFKYLRKNCMEETKENEEELKYRLFVCISIVYDNSIIAENYIRRIVVLVFIISNYISRPNTYMYFYLIFN
jgi:hypothetical protein